MNTQTGEIATLPEIEHLNRRERRKWVGITDEERALMEAQTVEKRIAFARAKAAQNENDRLARKAKRKAAKRARQQARR